ncbi:molybdenum cofactor guanylyltransferase [Dehalobacterium formicoaceticum]|uniref:Probable molybdenum cofactor guanylyltransferase n=2 Tax=Dehalobacterium formicoaceticum TaxID=51515 RepID=A0ABT1Y7P1_9FIRM|nr:molybdenum cofactor guanylyltransferase [Dehalobacterium formicoaceticum]MCR6546898.1 molybdenum cofactor guanylyltransferase [Dehalobacterium formicoaceticum]
MKVSGVILAGGKSRRMGQDKTLMTFNNETLIGHMIKELKDVTDEIIIASNHSNKYQFPGITEVVDIYPGKGPLAGVHAGLTAAMNEYAFVVSSDMPLFQGKLVTYLAERAPDYDVVVPKPFGYWEPLCALYSKNCLPVMEKYLRASDHAVAAFHFYPEVKVLEINEKELSASGNMKHLFYNVNTPEDYQALMRQENLKDNRKSFFHKEASDQKKVL